MIKIGDLKKLGLSLELDLGDVVEEIKGQPMVVKFGWRKVDDSSCLINGINIDLKSAHGGQVSYLPVKHACWELWSHWRPSIDWLSLQVIDKVLYVDNTSEFGGDVTTETPEEAEAFNKMKPYEFDEHVSGASISGRSEQTKPVFTQAMCDAGELPPVGSKCTLRYMHDSRTVTHSGIVAYASKKYCILNQIGAEVMHKIGDYSYEVFDTRTPKQKAIDEMLSVAIDSDDDIAKSIIYEACVKLVDKGYRK